MGAERDLSIKWYFDTHRRNTQTLATILIILQERCVFERLVMWLMMLVVMVAVLLVFLVCAVVGVVGRDVGVGVVVRSRRRKCCLCCHRHESGLQVRQQVK